MSTVPLGPPGAPTPEVREAATVMLLRDGDDGLEVFMVRRNLQSDFVGGAYVFPGGAVDASDRSFAACAVCRGRDDVEASRRLGVEAGGLAFWVAAARECFEEAGVLLAADAAGEVVGFGDPEVAGRFVEHRRAVDDGRMPLADVCAAESLALDVGAMAYFSHWITPVGPPRRYDTRFFVARAPTAQEPLEDDREVIAKLWVRPADALARHEAGELEMILPTLRNLSALARYRSSDEAVEAAEALDEVPAVLPRIVERDGRPQILLPGDDGYADLPSRQTASTATEGS